jgi:hypothetical protein
MAQSDLNVRTDGLRPSVRRLKAWTNQANEQKPAENLGVIHLKGEISIEFRNINVKCQYVRDVTDGQTSSSYFSLVSKFKSHTVDKSVRPYGGRSQKRRTKQTQNTDPIGGNIKRDRWHNLMEISMYGRTDFVRPYRTKKKRDRQRQTHRNTEDLGVAHLKELKPMEI